MALRIGTNNLNVIFSYLVDFNLFTPDLVVLRLLSFFRAFVNAILFKIILTDHLKLDGSLINFVILSCAI
jgi:hypothetical protein